MDFVPPANALDLATNNQHIGQTIAEADLIIPEISSPQLPQIAPLRIEAEDMILDGYRLESIDFASNQTVASFWGEAKGELGSATVEFSGATGKYDIILGYFDEEGGDALLDPQLNGQSLGRLKLDQFLGSNLPTPDNFVRHTVKQRVDLKAGDMFTVVGTEESNEHARIDYVEFVQVPELSNSSEVIRINSGGADYIDEAGNYWSADQFFDDGETIRKNVAIQGTEDDFLYQSERYAKTLDYAIPVANGTYDVSLLFAENYWSDNQQRTFNISVEGEEITPSLDIYAEAGRLTAFDQLVSSVLVTDGVLDIAMDGIADKATLSGLEILQTSLLPEAPILPSSPDVGNEPDETLPPATVTAQPLSSNATVRYISPDGSGDGSSWAQAASLNDLDSLIEQSVGGDEIWLAGDRGTYNVGGSIRVDSGSLTDTPIYIRGVASELGGDSTPLIVGDRAENWTSGQANGSEVFRLLEGANNLHFSDIDFENVGNGAFLLGGNLSNITLENMEADNVRRFVENYADEGASTASVSGLTVRDVQVTGFSKSAIRLQYDTNNVLIEDVFGDSERQDGDQFAMGVHLAGTVHNVVHRRVTMNNATQTRGANDYWNADGFVTDWGTYSITYEDTSASGSTDGGYDLKSKDTLLVRAAAADNKRNFRIWRNAMMIDVVSDEPFRRGGIGETAHVHVLGEEGNLTINGGTFSGDDSIDNLIFELDDSAQVQVNDAIITDNLYELQKADGNTSIQWNNLIEP